MPRIRKTLEELRKPPNPRLVAELASELQSNRAFGQPRIKETEFPTKAIHVVVIWDKWARLSAPERSDVILAAYEQVGAKSSRGRIALAIGLTFPEARELGELRYSLAPRVREGSSVSLEQCYQAMRTLGASELFHRGRPELWFATPEEMDAYLSRLKQIVPESTENWVCIAVEGSADFEVS